jgi:ankyrin repeat protein
MVEKLLGIQSLNVDSKDSSGKTPILYTAENRHLEVVKSLFKTGKANVHKMDKQSWLPVARAHLNKHIKVTQFLEGVMST